MGINIDILLVLIILNAAFLAFRAGNHARGGIAGKAKGQGEARRPGR
jgi:hypothetical protein